MRTLRTWALLCAALGSGCAPSCKKEDPPPPVADRPEPTLEGLEDGALLSQGAHDLVLLVHHGQDYSASEVDRQLRLARAAVDALIPQHEANQRAGRDGFRISVVAVGRRTEVIQTLTDDTAAWRSALANDASFEPQGIIPLTQGVEEALEELLGPRSRGWALPMVLHFATRLQAVTPAMVTRLGEAGVVLAYAGSALSTVQPATAQHTPSLLVPENADAVARLGSLLVWGGAPVALRARVKDGWGVRLVVLDEDGDIVLRQVSSGTRVEADLDWRPADVGRPLTVRVAATNPDRTDEERVYRALALAQDRQPQVVSVQPLMASPGQTVTVTGRFFAASTAASVVNVGVDATPVTATKTSLQFVVPVGAVDGELTVRVAAASSPPLVFRVDTDADGLADNDELADGTNPTLADTDGDGLNDAVDECPADVVGAGHVNATGCTLCTDGIKNGPETDLDCGGPCADCPVGRSCTANADCVSNGCNAGRCVPDHCTNGALDLESGERALDCGGPCTPCADGLACAGPLDCVSATCIAALCRPATCDNNLKDDSESSQDCGGVCQPCPEGDTCTLATDCQSARCLEGLCGPSLCGDEVLNGNESDVDCGGSCDGCDTGGTCGGPADCASGVCTDGVCTAPTCTDSVRNGDETGRDCGGGRCVACVVGEFCATPSDCGTGVCEAGVCAPPRCTDGARNGVETDVDCGGQCGRCSLGKGCAVDGDCTSMACQGARLCVLPTCLNAMRDPDESDVDCGGGCLACVAGRQCSEDVDCASRRCSAENLCLAPTCADGAANGDESDVDCGGSCPADCAESLRCFADADCASAVCFAGRCAAPSCEDDVRNGLETDVDCGGLMCGRCLENARCQDNDDCQSTLCIGQRCVSPTCADGELNGTETAVDCGGACPGCVAGELCNEGRDCGSGVCLASADAGGQKLCAEATCTDGVRNGNEGDVDCGGACAACAVGQTCTSGEQCAEGVCAAINGQTRCAAPSCQDGQYNGLERGPDCGGPCAGCDDGTVCGVAGDCGSGVCSAGADGGASTCAVPSCTDGVRNGAEASVDCGGTCAELCADSQPCAEDADCASGVCLMETCAAPSCTDGVRNGLEAAVDCGTGCTGCADGTSCTAATDCASRVCAGGTDAGPGACAVPTCEDGVANGAETSPDCGGGVCPRCGLYGFCDSNTDCAGELQCVFGGDVFEPGQRKQCDDVSSCSDGIRNRDESDVDCSNLGGCPACAAGRRCNFDYNCNSFICQEGLCRDISAFDGVQNGDETDVDCGGKALQCVVGQHCGAAEDCRSGWCHAGVCEAAPSCATVVLSNPNARSGVYPLQPPGAASPVQVRCDMASERGGWTLVANSAAVPVKDVAAEYTVDLARVHPLGNGQGVWRGLRELAGNNADVRFTCQVQAGGATAVDLSFFSVDWYNRITTGSEADSCFAVPGEVVIPPARRNNLTAEALGAGTPWERGALVGESQCDDTLDFTVDFGESGLDGDETDGTDWGEDDGLPKCGSEYAPAGAWQVWVREAVSACANNVRDGDETGVDCGGTCAPCLEACGSAAECPSGICRQGVCEPSRCVDRVKNGTETDVDCGGSCGPCPVRKACLSTADCDGSLCDEGICRPIACYDNAITTHEFLFNCNPQFCQLLTLKEPAVDCGGPCVPCDLGQQCYLPTDCRSATCPTSPVAGEDDVIIYVGVCSEDPCEDGFQGIPTGETDVDCGGPVCGKCGGGQRCQANTDCITGDCRAGVCRAVTSCQDAQDLLPGVQASGLYRLGTGAEAREVWCDMETDLGGWTLVASSAEVPPADEAGAFHADLQTLTPTGTHRGIWNGLRTRMGNQQDIRFACRPLTVTQGMVVDLSFYGVDWYHRITTGSDAASCFNAGDGAGFVGPAPARRNNVTGESLALATPWRAGFLEGEDECASPDDFTVDLRDRGMDGNEEDGTDWGMDDGLLKCGTFAPGGFAWFVFVREASTCRDGMQGPGEQGVDCGGPCQACPAAACGNNRTEVGEECDDGNTADGDGCNRFCRAETCGDGQWTATEECDDGNFVNGDGCSALCVIEPGFLCRSAADISTGTDLQGGRRNVGTQDLVWSWADALNGTYVPATVSGDCAPGSWHPAPINAQWINRNGCNQDSPANSNTFYRATFNIPTARAAAATIVEGTAWADNAIADVLVNGVATGLTGSGFNGAGLSFGDWPSSLYRAGVNTITVVVFNAPGGGGGVLNPDGLLVSVPGGAAQASICEAVASGLSGARWNLPCIEAVNEQTCSSAGVSTQDITIAGDALRQYDVRLRFRGVLEYRSYTGGEPAGSTPQWYAGGAPSCTGNPFTIVALQVSAPAVTYHVNNGPETNVTHVLDYEQTLVVQGGATVTLFSNGCDGQQVSNHQGNVVPGLDTQPYDGQYLRMDVLSVARR